MFAYSRLDEIFNYIRKHEYTSCERLASRFEVTERTIRNDIQELNDSLQGNGASIKLKRKYGYYIEVVEEKAYGDFLGQLEAGELPEPELDSSRDRIKYILNRLLSADDYIGLEEFMQEVYISKNTLNNYIKRIKEIIGQYDLEYIAKANAGIKIIGTEAAKRKCIIGHVLSSNFDNYITGFTKEERSIFKDVDLDYLKELMLSYLDENYIKTSDFNVKNLIIHLALMVSRIQNNHYITVDSVEMDEGVRAIVDSICAELEEHYDIAVSRGEKTYLYLHLIANTHMDVENINDEQLKEAIENMLQTIYDSYHFDLRHDGILKEDLFRHLKSIFVSKRYALNSRNPLLETIKNNYPLAFEMTLTAVTRVFVKEPWVLNEDDVGYVSLHIGAAIERCFAKGLEKKNVMLVCGSGQATTRMLEARLNVYFPEKINIVRSLSYNEFSRCGKEDFEGIDFIISTIALESNVIPSITVNFSLNNEDVEAVSQFLTKISVNKTQKTGQFFDSRLFFKLPEAESKEAVIEMLYQRLLDLDIVDARFLESVERRESLGNTCMNDWFALPHPMELCAKETKVAVALLDKPVLWKDRDMVQIVFLLAIKPGVQKDIEHLYDVFIEIVNDGKLSQKILKAKDFSSFINIVQGIEI